VLIVNGSELSEAHHGETEARSRAVLEDARRKVGIERLAQKDSLVQYRLVMKSPCIVVLDELDALCPARSDASSGSGEGGGSEVEQRAVATFLIGG
jgi:AAA family ATPase